MYPFSTPWKPQDFQGVEKGCIGNEWIKVPVIWSLWDLLQVGLKNHDEKRWSIECAINQKMKKVACMNF